MPADITCSIKRCFNLQWIPSSQGEVPIKIRLIIEFIIRGFCRVFVPEIGDVSSWESPTLHYIESAFSVVFSFILLYSSLTKNLDSSHFALGSRCTSATSLHIASPWKYLPGPCRMLMHSRWDRSPQTRQHHAWYIRRLIGFVYTVTRSMCAVACSSWAIFSFYFKSSPNSTPSFFIKSLLWLNLTIVNMRPFPYLLATIFIYFQNSK